MSSNRPISPHATGLDFGVVNYNGGPALRRCVRSILDQEGVTCRVWVLDNGSQDGSADGLDAELDGVTVIRAGKNLGYAGALNRLLEALETPVVVLSNMDVAYEPGWAQSVADALADSPGDGAATVVLEDTDPPVLNSLGVRFWGDLHAQNVGSGDVYRADDVRQARRGAFGSYGAVMCLRREVARSIGFDEDYFLFFEETDFFLRFHLMGHRLVFADGATALHTRSLSTRRYSLLKLYYGERNRLTTVFKLLPVSYWPAAGVQTLRRMIKLAWSGAGGTGPSNPDGATAGTPLPPRRWIVWTLARAWGGALLRLPGTLRKRRAFWRQCPASPRDALELLRRYRLSGSELRLR